MKPSLRFYLGKSPFRVGITIPIEDLVATVGAAVGALLTSATAREDTSRPILVEDKNPYVIIHDGGEVDIQPCSEQDAIDAAQKTLKLIDLKHPKLYRVEGDRRVEVAG